MNVAGGSASAQEQATRLGVPANDITQSAIETGRYMGSMPASQANCGRRNANTSQGGNLDAVQLGEEIGVFVMGQAERAAFITTPSDGMGSLNLPSGQAATRSLCASQSSLE